MNPDVSALLIQAPALGIVVYLVIHFLAHLSKRDVEYRNYIDAKDSDQRTFLVNVVSDYKQIVQKNNELIDENTKAFIRFNDSLSKRDQSCPMVSGRNFEPKPRQDGE